MNSDDVHGGSLFFSTRQARVSTGLSITGTSERTWPTVLQGASSQGLGSLEILYTSDLKVAISIEKLKKELLG